MKRNLLIAGAVFVLLPIFSTQAQATPEYTTPLTGPTVLLRCRENYSSTRRFSDRAQQIESYSTHSYSVTEHRTSRNSQIREILRRRRTDAAAETPVIIEIQGDCDAMRVEINAGHLQDELFPGEFDHSENYGESYEAWRDALRNHQHETYPWLTRTGSGWDWLLRQRGPYPTGPRSTDISPDHAPLFFSP